MIKKRKSLKDGGRKRAVDRFSSEWGGSMSS